MRQRSVIIKSFLIVLSLIVGLNSSAHARYYEPTMGRFISPDTIVPNANDPQSLNRYSYVRNNPVILTDPSGHSWLSSTINQAGKWVNQHREFSGLTWQMFDPFFGSAYLSTFGNGRAILAAQVIAAGSFGMGGSSVGWGAVSGEISSAYTARRNGGNMLMAVVRGGLEGAAIAATFSAIDKTTMPWAVKGLGKAAINASLVAAEGGDPKSIQMAAALSFTAEGANYYFKKTVGYAADPTPGVPLGTNDHTYPVENIRPPAGQDVFGNNDGKGGFWHQGSPAMRGASSVPGMQSVSQLHDTWMNTQHMNKAYLLGNQTIANIITMPPAFITSFSAQFSGPWAPAIVLSQQ